MSPFRSELLAALPINSHVLYVDELSAVATGTVLRKIILLALRLMHQL